ncbi:hypothetical protein [Infirmifilum sp.]|uniref:hypothetical protein n=1 Tax=Infirmifilum sp. TaxID=2856575 RepID=UPI003D0E597E
MRMTSQNNHAIHSRVITLLIILAGVVASYSSYFDFSKLRPPTYFNYDIVLFTQYRIFLFYCIIVMLWLITVYSKKARAVFLSLLITVLIYSSIIAVNFPFIIHRDAYLHGGPVEYIIKRGSLSGLEMFGRDDVVSWPGWFIFQSIYVVVTNGRVIESITVLTALYPLLVFLLFYAMFVERRFPKSASNFIGILPLLFLVNNYGLFTSSFARWHFAILLATILQSVLIDFVLAHPSKGLKQAAAIAIIVSATIILSHPYVATFMVTEILVLLVFFTSVHRLARDTLKYLYAIILFFVIHVIFNISSNFVELGFNSVLKYFSNPQIYSEFVVQSTPIRVKSLYPISEVAYVFRLLYRVFTVSTFLVLIYLTLRFLIANNTVGGDIKSLKFLTLSSLIAYGVISAYLVGSFLWFERTLYVAYLIFMPGTQLLHTWISKPQGRMGNHYKLAPIFLNVLILIALLSAVFISLEPNYSTIRVRYPWIDASLNFISMSNVSGICGGTFSTIYYSYFTIIRETVLRSSTLMNIIRSGTGCKSQYIMLSLLDPEIVQGYINTFELDSVYSRVIDAGGMVYLWWLG